MERSYNKMLRGYEEFRAKYADGDQSVMHYLSHNGQQPQVMIVACCDSRVDPALILQCDPGDLFVVRNVANIVPPYEKDAMHHGTSAALEFGIRFLNVKNLILLGHSQCGGIQTLLNSNFAENNDFISNWVSILDDTHHHATDVDDCAKLALKKSRQNCLTFPWIKERIDANEMNIHLWFFDIKTGSISSYSEKEGEFKAL
jgi:carbonic anhydrase